MRSWVEIELEEGLCIVLCAVWFERWIELTLGPREWE